MDYLGNSILELKSSDPAILAAIAALQQEVSALAQICSLEAQVLIPIPEFRESTAVEQPVTLSGVAPNLYQSNGYASVVGVQLIGHESPNLYRLISGNYAIGIRWERQATDTAASFHVSGCATFQLLELDAQVVMRMTYGFPTGEYYDTFYNRTRFPSRSSVAPTTRPCEYHFDQDIQIDFENYPDVQSVDFCVAVLENFTTPQYTNTLTGGWDTRYRNFIRVERIQ